MTEDEWKECPDPDRMLDHLEKVGRADSRRLRLFACACVRGVWDYLIDDVSRKVVEVAEQYADGLVCDQELSSARRVAAASKFVATNLAEHWAGLAAICTAWDVEEVASYYAGDETRVAGQVSLYAAWAWVEDVSLCWGNGILSTTAVEANRSAWTKIERKQQTEILRNLFGNPFC